MVQGPPKEINHRGTRFAAAGAAGNPAASATSSDSGVSASSAQAQGAGQGGQYGGGSAGQYSVLSTPSFAPGVEDSPLVTWGEIGATPMRIEAEDLPMGQLAEGECGGPSGRGGGPGCCCCCVVHGWPQREGRKREGKRKSIFGGHLHVHSVAHANTLLASHRTTRTRAHEAPLPSPHRAGEAKFHIKHDTRKEAVGKLLAVKAAASLKRRRPTTAVAGGLAAKAAGLLREGARGGGGSGGNGGPGIFGGGEGGQRPLSAAAARMATGMAAKQRLGTDSALRASYSKHGGATPVGGSSRRPTVTPRAASAAAPSSWESAANTPQRQGGGGSGWTPGSTPAAQQQQRGVGGGGMPAVHATLYEEGLRAAALLSRQEREAEGRREMEAARAAAMAAMGKQPRGVVGRQEGREGDSGVDARKGVTDGLLDIL
jgi:hypothetical protein